MAPPGDYKYDVFFSYKRHGLTLDWTRRTHGLLQRWLTEELAPGTSCTSGDSPLVEPADSRLRSPGSRAVVKVRVLNHAHLESRSIPEVRRGAHPAMPRPGGARRRRRSGARYRSWVRTRK